MKKSVNTGPSKNKVLLKAIDLSKHFGGMEVLRDVNLSLREGEVVLLRGPNGAGKTTLINILTGHMKPDNGKITVRANGSDKHFTFPVKFLARLNPFQDFLPEHMAEKGIMRTWQDSRLFASLNLVENIAIAAPGNPSQNPINLFFSSKKIKKFENDTFLKANKLLGEFQLTNQDDSSGDKISLGQAKRVATAVVVNAGARILFFDEPLAGLDNQGINTILEMLRDLAKKKGVSVVVVEHQLYSPFILEIADTVWTLENGILESQAAIRSKETGCKTDRHVFTKLIEGAGWQVDRKEELPRGATLNVYRLPNVFRSEDPLLELRDFAVRRGKRWVIGRPGVNDQLSDKINLQLYRGDLALLFAPNGWGKTTALDAISGLIPPASGTICFKGQQLNDVPSWNRARMGLRYLRARDNIFPSLSVAEQGSLAGGQNSVSDELRNRKVGTLSGGERQRIKVSEYLRDFPILDEPFTGLDSYNLEKFVRNLSKLNGALIALPSIETQRGEEQCKS